MKELFGAWTRLMFWQIFIHAACHIGGAIALAVVVSIIFIKWLFI